MSDDPKTTPDAKASDDATKNAAATAAAVLAIAGTTTSEPKEEKPEEQQEEKPLHMAYEDPCFKPFRVSYVQMRPGADFDREYISLTCRVALPDPQSKTEGEFTWIIPRTNTSKSIMDRLVGHVKVHGPAQTFIDICNRLAIKGPPNTSLLGEEFAARQEQRSEYLARNSAIQGDTRRPTSRAPSAARNAALDALAD